jgi:hypothetical protein
LEIGWLVLALSDFFVQVLIFFLSAMGRSTLGVKFLELPVCSCGISVGPSSGVFGWLDAEVD